MVLQYCPVPPHTSHLTPHTYLRYRDDETEFVPTYRSWAALPVLRLLLPGPGWGTRRGRRCLAPSQDRPCNTQSYRYSQPGHFRLTPSFWRREGSCCSLRMTEGDSCPGPDLPCCPSQTVLESVCPAVQRPPRGRGDLRHHRLLLLLVGHYGPGSVENHRATRVIGTGFQLAIQNSSQSSHSNLALIPQLS